MKYVYFIRRADGIGPIKIGISACPAERAKPLARQVGHKLVVLAEAVGTFADERRVHAHFRGHGIGHEWFRPIPALLEMVREVAVSGRIPLFQTIIIDTFSEAGSWAQHLDATACMRPSA